MAQRFFENARPFLTGQPGGSWVAVDSMPVYTCALAAPHAPHPVAHCAPAAPHCSSPGCALRTRRSALLLTLLRIAQPPRRTVPHPVAHCATAAPHCSSPGCALRNRRAALLFTRLRTAQPPLPTVPHPVAHCATAAPQCGLLGGLRTRRSMLRVGLPSEAFR
jgi:hypothetical protein